MLVANSLRREKFFRRSKNKLQVSWTCPKDNPKAGPGPSCEPLRVASPPASHVAQ